MDTVINVPTRGRAKRALRFAVAIPVLACVAASAQSRAAETSLERSVTWEGLKVLRDMHWRDAADRSLGIAERVAAVQQIGVIAKFGDVGGRVPDQVFNIRDVAVLELVWLLRLATSQEYDPIAFAAADVLYETRQTSLPVMLKALDATSIPSGRWKFTTRNYSWLVDDVIVQIRLLQMFADAAANAQPDEGERVIRLARHLATVATARLDQETPTYPRTMRRLAISGLEDLASSPHPDSEAQVAVLDNLTGIAEDALDNLERQAATRALANAALTNDQGKPALTPDAQAALIERLSDLVGATDGLVRVEAAAGFGKFFVEKDSKTTILIAEQIHPLFIKTLAAAAHSNDAKVRLRVGDALIETAKSEQLGPAALSELATSLLQVAKDETIQADVKQQVLTAIQLLASKLTPAAAGDATPPGPAPEAPKAPVAPAAAPSGAPAAGTSGGSTSANGGQQTKPDIPFFVTSEVETVSALPTSSDSPSRVSNNSASLVESRVSQGPTPPSQGGKRFVDRDIPANQRPGLRVLERSDRNLPQNQRAGLRQFSTEAGPLDRSFRPFRSFREYGTPQRSGASEAPGVPTR